MCFIDGYTICNNHQQLRPRRMSGMSRVRMHLYKIDGCLVSPVVRMRKWHTWSDKDYATTD